MMQALMKLLVIFWPRFLVDVLETDMRVEDEACNKRRIQDWVQRTTDERSDGNGNKSGGESTVYTSACACCALPYLHTAQTTSGSFHAWAMGEERGRGRSQCLRLSEAPEEESIVASSHGRRQPWGRSSMPA